MLTDLDLIRIENSAGGLSEKEVCDLLKLDYDHIQSDEFVKAYRYAQVQMKMQAVNALRNAMVGKQGMESSLAVLTRFADKWPKAPEDSGVGAKKAFRVVFDD